MDGFKEIFEAFHSKVKSPILGSILIATVLYNWKVLFYISFSNTSIADKFKYFDENTGWISLLTPIGIGFLIAFVSPFLNWIGAEIAKYPVYRIRILQEVERGKILDKKQELEAKRLDFAKSLLVAAKQEQAEIASIKNEETRNELQKQIDGLRKNMNSSQLQQNSLSKEDEGVLESRILSNESSAIINSLEIVELQEAFKAFQDKARILGISDI